MYICRLDTYVEAKTQEVPTITFPLSRFNFSETRWPIESELHPQTITYREGRYATLAENWRELDGEEESSNYDDSSDKVVGRQLLMGSNLLGLF